MKLLLLISLLAMACTAHATWCDDRYNGKCVSKSTFCWNNREYKCANGSFRCKDGACASTSTYPFLPGKYHRYACLNNKDFANGRYVKTCAPGTSCWGNGTNQYGESPCHFKHHKGMCKDGNGACINDRQYCENGQTYTCAKGLVCAGPSTSPLSGKGHVVAPCVRMTPY